MNNKISHQLHFSFLYYLPSNAPDLMIGCHQAPGSHFLHLDRLLTPTSAFPTRFLENSTAWALTGINVVNELRVQPNQGTKFLDMSFLGFGFEC